MCFTGWNVLILTRSLLHIWKVVTHITVKLSRCRPVLNIQGVPRAVLCCSRRWAAGRAEPAHQNRGGCSDWVPELCHMHSLSFV